MIRAWMSILFLFFFTHVSAQHLVANINQTNGGSRPDELMGNANYGVFFARPDDTAFQLFFLDTASDSLKRFGTDIPIQIDDIIWDSKLIGDDVYFRTFNFERAEETFHRANLTSDSLFTLAQLGASGSSSGINNFTPLDDGTQEVLFIHRNEAYTFQLFRTDGSSEGTHYLTDLPDNQFVSQIATQGTFAYLVYPADFFEGRPASLYLNEGVNTTPVDLPLQTDFGLEVTPFGNKVLLSGFSRDSFTHLLADPGLSEFRSLSTFSSDTNTLFLRTAFISGDQVYYTRNGENFAHELLRTDTSATRLDTVVNLNPGQDSVGYFAHTYDSESGLLFFLGRKTTDGSVSLYRSDLTEAGTFVLGVVQPAGASIANIGTSNKLVNGKFYFKAFRTETGEELWVSDGTVEGTKAVDDLIPGVDDALIDQLTKVGERVMFTASTINFGQEVLISDGSKVGTRLLSDINTKEAGSNPGSFFTFRDTLFFRANNGCNGSELHKSGGSAATTRLVRDIILGRDGYSIFGQLELADKFYFTASGTGILIESDGTESGTKEIVTNSVELGIQSLSPPGRVGNQLLITAFSGVSQGQILYRYNPLSGQIDSLKRLSDIGFNSSNSPFMSLTDSVTLFTNRSSNGLVLYRTDGTSEGTVVLPLNNIFDPRSIQIRKVDNGVAFVRVIVDSFNEYLFRTDGTVGGTRLLNNVSFDNIRKIFTYQGELHFFADQFGSTNLYRIDSTNQIIRRTALFNGAGRFAMNAVAKGDTIFFTATTEAAGAELWIIPGPGQLARQLIDLRAGPDASFPRELTLLSGSLFFTAEASDGNRDLYVSDGSTDGTVSVRSISNSQTAFAPSSLYTHDGFLYFSARDTLYGQELFRFDPSDPTNTGTVGDPDVIVAHCVALPDTTVNVLNTVLDQALNVFPNPTADLLTINLDGVDNRNNLRLAIFSQDGRKILEGQTTSNSPTISLGGLPPGTYFLHLRDVRTGGFAIRSVLKY
ncbi:T9SS type A sorting domain-containing protein [Neolewinella agarilytica]|uniref:T9SS type A sorting domain-containing protein n=1 Tax=Neolewinella agarilytica TaxID=478744 RepID=UPI00235669A0|nr:T9SS type A sorting domain-containing protein [Neolewinella agarilytica]